MNTQRSAASSDPLSPRVPCPDRDVVPLGRVLVTGGAGFIGSHLVEALFARGDHVTVIDTAVTTDIQPGNRPGNTLANWLIRHADQVWLFTTHFAVDWTSNAAERGIKPAKRHQAVSGYWQNTKTLARWRPINSYLTSARNHRLTVLNAIAHALTGNPWLPIPIAA